VPDGIGVFSLASLSLDLQRWTPMRVPEDRPHPGNLPHILLIVGALIVLSLVFKDEPARTIALLAVLAESLNRLRS
jgi:hypothetical protein